MADWISHRGVREGHTVENTEASFLAAVRKGFSILETDLRLTADHQLILSHDVTLERLGGSNVPVVAKSRAQLAATTLADGQRPFFFDEFAEAHRRQRWVLDIKPETSAAALRVLLRTVKAFMPIKDFAENTSFVVWNTDDEQFLKTTLPNPKIYARQSRCWRAGLSLIWGQGLFSGINQPGEVFSVTPSLWGKNLFTKELVDRYHKRGAKVLAFLPRTEAEFRAAMTAGCDEILSDGWYPK